MIGSIQGTCVSYVYTSLGESEYHSCAVRISEIHEDEDRDRIGLADGRIKRAELQACDRLPKRGHLTSEPALHPDIDLAVLNCWIVENARRVERQTIEHYGGRNAGTGGGLHSTVHDFGRRRIRAAAHRFAAGQEPDSRHREREDAPPKRHGTSSVMTTRSVSGSAPTGRTRNRTNTLSTDSCGPVLATALTHELLESPLGGGAYRMTRSMNCPS